MRENDGQRKPVNWCILRSANDSTRKTDIYQEDYRQMIVCLLILLQIKLDAASLRSVQKAST